MKKEFELNKFEFNEDLPKMSKRMLDEHIKLYEGYIKKANEIILKIEEADKSEANASYSFIGELKRQETFSVNGLKLHELYFGHLGGNGEINGKIKLLIERDFGSIEAWKEDIVATGLSARGWAILAFDYRTDSLHNYGSDAHNIGAVWGAIPLLALDVYEHAYFIDYGIARKDYIEAFFKNINWDYVNKLLDKYNIN